MFDLDFNKIYKFAMKDLKIMLDINSGSVHIIDEITWDYLDKLELTQDWRRAQEELLNLYPGDKLEAVIDELQGLIKNNLLFSPEPLVAEYEEDTREQVVKALCLHVAHDCNLRCGYCFAGTGSFSGERSLMDRETGERAIDFLLEASGNRKNIEVDFFGGEPLLNFKVVKELVYYGQRKAQEQGKHLKFTITTNGVLLNEEIGDFLDANDLDVVLSLDGRPEVHDKMRPFPKGVKSYDLIKKHILNFAEKRNHKNYYVRGTFTRHNLDFAQDIKHLAQLGFKEISLEPVVAAIGEDYGFLEEDLPAIRKQYDLLTDYYWDYYQRGNPFNFFHFNIDLDHGPCLPKRLSGCGAGHEYLAVSPEGDLYPCHQFVGKEDYKIGHISTGVVKPEVPKEFKASHVLKKDECRSCWARFHCSGGCHSNNLAFRNSLLKPYKMGCEIQKKRLECAIYLQVLKHLNPQ